MTQNQKMGKNKFYLDEESADVHFLFDNGNGNITSVAAHKVLLASGSIVFYAMFYGVLKENGDVKIVDASEGKFKEFLQFFYRRMKGITLTMENIDGVMYLGHKYQVPKCIAKCVEFLKSILNVDNVFTGLELGILFDQEELKNSCSEIIKMNTVKVFQTSGF